MDLISVIVPIYKVEDYLNRCILSLVNQTYKNLEIILVDDGSPDDCPEMCDKWKARDERITVVHQKNGGLSSARNTGLDAATGNYVFFLDSDDYVSPYALEKLIEVTSGTDADMVISNCIKGTDEHYIFPKSQLTVEVLSAKDTVCRIYESSDASIQYGIACGKLYKKCLFDNIRYPQGKIFEDMYVTHRVIARCSTIAVINDSLYYYYQRPHSIINESFNIKKLDYLDACKDRIKHFKDYGWFDISEVAYDEYLHSLIWEYSRVRDILRNKEVMRDIKERYRKAYCTGLISKRYPTETRWFLYMFYLEPEIIILYWRIRAKVQKICKRFSIEG